MAWQFLKKLNTNLPYDPEILPSSIYPKRNENICLIKDLDVNVYSNFIHNKQKMVTISMSIISE